MRKFVAVAVLGGALALGTGAAFANDTTDYRGPYQPVQSEPTVSQAESDHSMVAGGEGAPTGVYQQVREENRESGR